MGDVHDLPPDREAVAAPLHSSTWPDEGSARLRDFSFHPGDIVISTRSKLGTPGSRRSIRAGVPRGVHTPH